MTDFSKKLDEILMATAHDLEWVFPGYRGAVPVDREKQDMIVSEAKAQIKAAIKECLPEENKEHDGCEEDSLCYQMLLELDQYGYNAYRQELISRLGLE